LPTENIAFDLTTGVQYKCGCQTPSSDTCAVVPDVGTVKFQFDIVSLTINRITEDAPKPHDAIMRQSFWLVCFRPQLATDTAVQQGRRRQRLLLLLLLLPLAAVQLLLFVAAAHNRGERC
jgi:hypothetical protein